MVLRREVEVFLPIMYEVDAPSGIALRSYSFYRGADRSRDLLREQGARHPLDAAIASLEFAIDVVGLGSNFRP